MSASPPHRQMALRSYLVLLIAGSMVPFLFVSGVLLLRVLRDNRAGIERTLLESARQQAAALDAELDATVRTLEALALSASLARDDLATFGVTLRDVARLQPGWLSVRLLAVDGRILFNSARPNAEQPGTAVDLSSLQEVVHSLRPVVATLRPGPTGQLAFAVRVPVLHGDRLRYVLTAVLSPEIVAKLVSDIAPAVNEWTRVIVDTNGTVVARTRSPELFVGQAATASFLQRTGASHDGFYQDTSLEGAIVYVAFTHSVVAGWVSAVVVPVVVMDGPLRQSMSMLVLVGLLVLVASSGGAYWLAGRISSDLGGATLAAEALSRGRPVPASSSIVSDVTRLSQALDQSGTLLIRRSEERDRHLAQAEATRADAEKANLAKDQFLAMLGHELRNPLAPMATALALLRLRGTAWTKEHAVLERQVEHMSRLVDDLLDVSRITRGELEIRHDPVELEDVITRATDLASPLLEEHRHTLHVHVPRGLVVRGDSVRLAQIFGNLLTNAAEYTPDGGAVTVRAWSEGDEIAIDVTDSGRGIPPDLAPYIFDLFVQGPRTIDRREGGLGLGLAIARSLAALHGGRIAAHSDGPGHGSTFTVHLPAYTSEPPATIATPPPADAGGRPRRVLVVDDNPDSTDMLSMLLTMSGHQVATAPDGPQALAVLEGFDADVAVLDIGLPVMDGYELARRIRELKGSRGPLLVAVTGYGQAEDVERSRAAGFNHHLVKPVDHELLLQLVSAAL